MQEETKSWSDPAPNSPSADSSSAWLCERLTAFAANSYWRSNGIIGLARIHLLLFPLTLMTGVEGEGEGGSTRHKAGLTGSFFRTSLEQRSNPYPKHQNKIHLHRARFRYPNRHYFFSFSSSLLKTHLQVLPVNIPHPSFIHSNCDLRWQIFLPYGGVVKITVTRPPATSAQRAKGHFANKTRNPLQCTTGKESTI